MLGGGIADAAKCAHILSATCAIHTIDAIATLASSGGDTAYAVCGIAASDCILKF